MNRLHGVWHGRGIATFPTISTVEYRDKIIFQPHAEDAILQVEQKSWHIHPDPSETLLHWECGFIRQLSETTCEWINAQNNGRTEVLKGHMQSQEDIFYLNLKSVDFGNDERMIASTRQFRIVENILSYAMTMATQAVSDIQQHLSSEFHRQ